jgi:PAS domain S-box-containing protein
MKGEEKTKEQLISELIEMRRRIAELEAVEAERLSAEQAGKRVEQALAESESRLRSILASMDDLVFVFDGQSRFTRCYSTVGELYMLPEEFLGKKHSEVMSPYIDRLFVEAFNKAKKGEVAEYEYQLGIGGETKWYSAKLSPMFLDDEFAGSVAVARNITERKRAEEALRETRDYLENLFNYANAPIIVWDPEFRITRFNRAFERLTGKSASEVLGASLDILFPEARREEAMAHIHLTTVGERWEVVEIPILGADGAVRTVLWNSATLYAADGTTVVATIAQGVDITERKRAEEALQRRNRALALLNRVGQELAATLDLQQIIEQLLDEVTEIVGAEGGSVWLWDEQRQEDLVCQAASPRGQRHSLVNLRLRPGQGIAGWVAQERKSTIVASTSDDPHFFPGVDEQTGFRTSSLLAVPLRVRDAIVGVLEVVNKRHGDFDADDLILVETLAASAAIAIENAGLVDALRQYAAELEARNEELDAFAHTVAHDLKGPLAPLVGYAEILVGDYATALGPEGLHYLRKVVRGGRKMSRIIDELLLLAGARKMEVDAEPLNMASIVAEAQQRLADMIEEYQAEIVLPDTWPTALGYSPWVEEVWINYLSNALKHGGRPPRVELGASPPSVPFDKLRAGSPDIGGEAKGGLVRFWIRDNGPGISSEEQSRLFTPFTRFDQVRTKGYGLGLSIVRRIVEKLGGQVGVESEVGQGSVFTFTLPGCFTS